MWLIPHVAAWIPVLWLVWDIGQSGWPFDPVADFTALSGDVALKLLLATLAITPALRFGAPKWVAGWRRQLGVYAFAYVCGHVWVYVGLDYAWDWQLMSANLLSKRYLIAGSVAALLLVPLAITSTKGWQRRLRRGWKWLHRHRALHLAGQKRHPGALHLRRHRGRVAGVASHPHTLAPATLATYVTRPACRRHAGRVFGVTC